MDVIFGAAIGAFLGLAVSNQGEDFDKYFSLGGLLTIIYSWSVFNYRIGQYYIDGEYGRSVFAFLTNIPLYFIIFFLSESVSGNGMIVIAIMAAWNFAILSDMLASIVALVLEKVLKAGK